MADPIVTDYTRHPTTLLVADGAAAALAREAVAIAGGRLSETLNRAAALAGTPRETLADILLVELEDADDEMLGALLPVLGALDDVHIIVALAEHQIDPVAAALSGPSVDLLCAPGTAERVAALAIAGVRGKGRRVREPGRGSDDDRFRRLNEEVARIAEMLVRLTRDEGLPGNVSDRSPAYRAAPAADIQSPSAREVRNLLRARRMRAEYFDAALFEDPAWDMLLDLFAAELERAQVSVSSLCIAAACAPTTALRWIGRMTEAGLFERRPDPFDKRRVFLALTADAREGMQRYFGAIRAAGLMMV